MQKMISKINNNLLFKTNKNVLDYMLHSDFETKARFKKLAKELVDKTLYTLNSPIIEGVVEKIDENWKNDNKKGMKYYTNYIKNYIEFMELKK